MQKSDVKTLVQARGKYRKVRLDRGFGSSNYTYGYVLDVSPELLLLARFRDFNPDGAGVFRMSQIRSVRSGELERLWDRMYAAEGLLDAVGISTQPPVDSMHSMLEHLFEVRVPVIIEVESGVHGGSDDEDDDGFLIGYITSVEPEVCWIHNFDGAGDWDDEPTPVVIDEITQVQIEAPYTTTFLRHIPPHPLAAEQL